MKAVQYGTLFTLCWHDDFTYYSTGSGYGNSIQNTVAYGKKAGSTRSLGHTKVLLYRPCPWQRVGVIVNSKHEANLFEEQSEAEKATIYKNILQNTVGGQEHSMYKRVRTLEVIERKRKEMIEASARYGLSSKEVLMRSQELDVLLNRYQSTYLQKEVVIGRFGLEHGGDERTQREIVKELGISR